MKFMVDDIATDACRERVEAKLAHVDASSCPPIVRRTLPAHIACPREAGPRKHKTNTEGGCAGYCEKRKGTLSLPSAYQSSQGLTLGRTSCSRSADLCDSFGVDIPASRASRTYRHGPFRTRSRRRFSRELDEF